MDELPAWTPGTAAMLSVAGPHAIPVSTAVRLGADRIAFALGRRRETLRRLREDPAAALLVFAPELAFTAYGTTTVVEEAVDASDGAVALELRVERIQDHLAGARTEIVEAVKWRWTDAEAAATDAAIRAELEARAGER